MSEKICKKLRMKIAQEEAGGSEKHTFHWYFQL